MQHSSNIATPYAKAIFQIARKQQQFSLWSDLLSLLATIVADQTLKHLLDNPKIRADSIVELLLDIINRYLTLPKALDGRIQRFLMVLLKYHRLSYARQINQQYHMIVNDYNKLLIFRIKVAKELTQAQQQQLSQTLKKRFKKDIELAIEIDPTLIGGIMIYINDTVIDRSIIGKLKRLSYTLKEGHHG